MSPHLVRHGGKQLGLKDNTLNFQIQNPFLQEALEIWTELSLEQNPKDIYKTSVWYNSSIKVNRVPFFYKNWSIAGIDFVEEIRDQHNEFLPYSSFKEKDEISATFLVYFGIVSAVKKSIKNTKGNAQLLKSASFNKAAYKHLSKTSSQSPQKVMKNILIVMYMIQLR